MAKTLITSHNLKVMPKFDRTKCHVTDYSSSLSKHLSVCFFFSSFFHFFSQFFSIIQFKFLLHKISMKYFHSMALMFDENESISYDSIAKLIFFKIKMDVQKLNKKKYFPYASHNPQRSSLGTRFCWVSVVSKFSNLALAP